MNSSAVRIEHHSDERAELLRARVKAFAEVVERPGVSEDEVVQAALDFIGAKRLTAPEVRELGERLRGGNCDTVLTQGSQETGHS